MVPLAYGASQLPLYVGAPPPPPAPPPAARADAFLGAVAPLSLDHELTEPPVPDSAFAEIDALAIPAVRPELLAIRPVAATIAAETANVRGGPGTEYDQLGTLPSGTALSVLARAGEWFKAQQADGTIVWVTAELLAVDQTAAALLPNATDIPALPPPRIGVVAEEGLNLRDGPGTDYIGMTRLPRGLQLDLIARYNDWVQVQTADGQAGWVRTQYLALQPGVMERVAVVPGVPEANPALVGTIRDRNVNVRGGPGTAYGKLGTLGRSTQLELLGRYEDWFKVRTAQGTTGWVSSELIEVSPFVARRVVTTRDIPALPRPQPAASPQAARPAQAAAPAVGQQPAPAVSASGRSVVEFALQFVGSKYVWGGASPKGFDCSGFTMYVYKQYGLNLPHSSEGQYSSKYGAAISNPDELAPGDIVFFVNTYKRGISHVGVYVGGGNVVQAMSPELGVGVANLNSGYWAQHYYGAIRPNV